MLLILFFSCLILPAKSHAIVSINPDENNMFGIHILFPEEVNETAKLVNSSGGDWGYVTIPIQAGDKNILRWQKFMDDASTLHLIPILRLSTEGDLFTTGVWRKPDYYDIIDFANFLNSLNWPVKNRYIILFNEVNRFDEWGGDNPDPLYYADLVSFSNLAFKSLNEDFYLILGAFDNASINIDHKYLNEFEFLSKMAGYNPEIFNKIDGFASHSYPNPGFLQAPNSYKRMGTYTYNFEYEYINSLSNTKKPAFITETGWNSSILSDDQVAKNFADAFQNIWLKDKGKIAAVTPFLLTGGSQFAIFSFIKEGKPTAYYNKIGEIEKIKGKPVLSTVMQLSLNNFYNPVNKSFKNQNFQSHNVEINPLVKMYLQMILGLR